MIHRPVLIVLISLAAVIIGALVGAWWQTTAEPPRDKPADSPSEIDQARATAARTSAAFNRALRAHHGLPARLRGLGEAAREHATRAPSAPPSGSRTQGDQGHR